MTPEISDVKTAEDCFEIATVDCSNDEEAAVGWLTCLQDVFEGVRTASILGETVRLKGLDLDGNCIVAVCESDENRIKVTLDSIQIPKLTKIQKLWLKAYQDRDA